MKSRPLAPNPLPPAVLSALRALAVAARLPVMDLPAEGEVGVAVPAGFESLFSRVSLRVSWLGPEYVLVEWDYAHPSGGMNGLEIGAVAYDEAAGRWAWRCASTRTTGHVAG